MGSGQTSFVSKFLPNLEELEEHGDKIEVTSKPVEETGVQIEVNEKPISSDMQESGVTFISKKRKSKTSEEPGSLKRQKVVLNEERKENYRNQKVLLRRFFDFDLAKILEIKELIEIVEFQNWTHLFVSPAPCVYETEVIELYANLCHINDCTMVLSVNRKEVVLNESILGEILEVQTDGMKNVSRKALNAFKNVIARKEEFTTKSKLLKKELKPEY
ncbi:hypothetical protein RND71_022002 [Anisodus tanguticus]|uniref:Uncharacterized protein n=1 Tax=Anisodus tanguticus TaxID=243964 RepID=A0AAE1RXM2_9SOLA|nr:hypothetical protein RND71_022002 [Anisodus tanguticus]